MLKKSLTMITLLCAMVPMAAYAASWSLATRVSTVGGTITSRNTAAAQTSANGTVFKTYTTTKTSVPVTIAPATGYAISALSVNGVAQTIPYTGVNPVNMGLVTFPGKTSQAVVVSFAAVQQLSTVTIAAGDGGTATPVGTFKVRQGSTAIVTFKPNAGNSFTGVTGVTPLSYKDASTGSTVTLPYNGAVKVTFTVPSTPATAVTGNFSIGLAATASASATTVLAGATVDLSASFSTTGSTPTFTWTQTGGPELGTQVNPWTATGSPVTTPALNLPVTTPATTKAVYSFVVTATNNVGSTTAGVSVVVNATAPTPPTALQTVKNQCITCHNMAGVGVAFNSYSTNHHQVAGQPAVYTSWSTSVHKANGVVCASCHVGADTSAHPGVLTCNSCHTGVVPTTHVIDICASCHGGNIHAATAGGAPAGLKGCVDCHDVAIQHPATANGVVSDNNGVRAITSEFSKWSHHVTGVALQNQHCAVCHLEGQIVGGQVVVDPAKHMADAKTHLRNADTDGDLQWDPAAPNHSTMDTFCMSCHDSDGALSTTVATIMATATPAPGKTFSATNPFADTISNQYDKLERPAVVDAKGQFDPSNPSHHAVRGKRYTGNSRLSSGTNVRTIADTAAFTVNSSVTLPGKRQTMFDAGKFEATYVTLANDGGESNTLGSLTGRTGGLALGDDSTLHCGDCHTVGQFRAADVNPATGSFNKAVIGAHGSNNEYLLRNNVGTDQKHVGVKTNPDTITPIGFGTEPYLVCFNCHKFSAYGSTYANTAASSPTKGGSHVGEYAKQDRCNGPYNTIYGDMEGEGRLLSITTNLPAYGQPAGSDFGNAFGIQCANCHNSGVSAGNMFGGIHGSKDQTYTDGMGNTTKHYRFLPGLGNSMFVPGVRGGFFEADGVTPKAVNATYAVYSGNRNGSGTGKTTGQTFTQLPVRTIIDGITVKTGSYEYVTGGVSSDLNWEQAAQQVTAYKYGATNKTIDLQSKAMGCYTLSPTGTLKLTAAANGRDALAATDGQTGPDGRELFGNWGGCDDHNGAQGAGTGIYRNVIRKTQY